MRDFIGACAVCQKNKTGHLHPAGLLQPLEIPTSVWADISMDFIEGLPKVGGKFVILSVVDRFSKYAHFVTLGHPYTASSVACAFFTDIVRLHGMPSSIASDRDPVFTSNFWTELFRLAGVKLHLSSAFHPQSDGQTEVVNRIITMYLRCLVGDRPRHWVQWLPWAEYCYNSSFQTTLKETPFRVVYGRDPPSLLTYAHGSARVAAVDQKLQDRDEFLQEIRERLVQAQAHMKIHHDKQRRDVEFEIGQWVWLRLQHRAAVSVTDCSSSKLAPRYYGPFKILARVGSVAYRLHLPPHARLHDVFHVGLLKEFRGDPPTSLVSLPNIIHGRAILTPAKIVRSRLNRGTCELLVQWEGCSAADATWETLATFQHRFPSFQLEDELILEEGGNVVDSFVGRHYSRRPKPLPEVTIPSPARTCSGETNVVTDS